MRTIFKRSLLKRELKRVFKENAEQGKPLSLMNDIVFKAMLTADTDDSRAALRSLLSACIRREVTKVRVANNDLIPAHLDAKASRLDVHVTFNNGEAADLEMQMGKSGDDLKSRATLYNAMLLAGQSKKGGSYKAIKRVYQIFFLNDILFPGSEKVPRRYSYREETEHDRLTEIQEIIFYEMPKLELRALEYFEGKLDGALHNDEKWCIYMKYRHNEDAAGLVEKLSGEEEGIMRAERAVEGISRDYLKFAREMAITKNRMDRAQEREDAREEGLAEGMENKQEEIARNALAEGLPIEVIQKITGLDMETIIQMRN